MLLLWLLVGALMAVTAAAGGVYLFFHQSVAAVAAHTPDVELAQKRLDQRILDLYFDQHQIEAQDTNDPKRGRRVGVERLAIGEAQRVTDLINSFYVNPPEVGAQWSGAGAFNENKAETVSRALNLLPAWPALLTLSMIIFK